MAVIPFALTTQLLFRFFKLNYCDSNELWQKSLAIVVHTLYTNVTMTKMLEIMENNGTKMKMLVIC